MNDRSIQAGGLGVDGTAAGSGGGQLDGQAGRGIARGQHHCACGRGRHLCHGRTDARKQNERMANCHGRLSRGSSEFGDNKGDHTLIQNINFFSIDYHKRLLINKLNF